MGKKKQKGIKAKETIVQPHSSPSLGPKDKPIGQNQIVPFDLNVVYQALRLKENKSLIQAINHRRNQKPLVTLILAERAQLMPDIILPLFEVLSSMDKKDEIDVFLSTTGGATEVPWRIVSLIREFCTRYTAIIPFLAMSAGTHIALGANTLLMSEISTLGPVDPSPAMLCSQKVKMAVRFLFLLRSLRIV